MYHRDLSDNSKVTISDFVIVRKLGRGSFGCVNLVSIKQASLKRLEHENPPFHKILSKYTHFALKELNKRTAKFYNQTFATHSEVNILKKLTSVNFPPKCEQPILLSSFQDKFNYYILTDYKVHAVELFELLSCVNIPFELILYFLYLFFNYIKTLHRFGVLHGDIKPENIIISQDGNVSFIDFGTSKLLYKKNTYIYNITNIQTNKNNTNSSDSYLRKKQYKSCDTDFNNLTINGVKEKSSIKGSVQFLPPEVLSKETTRNIYTDYWALGVTMFYMAFKKLPFKEKTDYLTIQKIIEQNNDKIKYLVNKELSNIYKENKQTKILKEIFGVLLDTNYKQRMQVSSLIKRISDSFHFKNEKVIQKYSDKMNHYLLIYRTIAKFKKEYEIIASGECEKSTWWSKLNGFMYRYLFWVNLEATLFVYNVKKNTFKEVIKKDNWEIKENYIYITKKKGYKLV